MRDFVHLHLHTVYSLLDGACKIGKKSSADSDAPLFARAKELGQKSIAITDHGNMSGAIEFYKEAKAAGLKPIIGCEVYVAAKTMQDKSRTEDNANYHLVLLAKDLKGYHNLVKIVSIAQLEGFYIKPRCDMSVLRQYSEGLVCLSACLVGEIPRLILAGDYNGAMAKAKEYKEIFKDDYYIELQDHNLPEDKIVTAGLVKIAKELEIPLVATNDVHYIDKKDAGAQQIMMCAQTQKKLSDPDKMSFGTDEFYLKSGDEMAGLFAAYPEAVENTVKIAEKCNLELKFHQLLLPKFTPPHGDSESYLRELCEKGFKNRYENPPEGAQERLEYEIETIKNMGYIDYFLIVWDFINYAKSKGIPVGPGRGSAAGSIVSYCLEITDIEPLSLGLLFERFLNPERVSMPDIDIDFCFNRRQEVIDYVVEKYGSDHVAQIVTFGTLLAKGAIREVGRVLDYPYAEVDAVAKMIPEELKITIESALGRKNSDLRTAYDSDETIKKLIDTAILLEGTPKNTSTHAAGVVITGSPVSDLVPLLRNDNIAATQYTMGTLEELGLLKMDFLGLRNLTVISDCEKMLAAKGIKIDVTKIGYDDEAVYKLLSDGNTAGVFQLESGGMRNVLTNLKPKNFEDIIAVISLFRPGPMESIPRYIESMHNPSKVRYRHPMLKNILDVTYGCLVYQEQVMQIVREMAGYSYGRADLVRRAMSKKKESEMKKEREVFVYGSEGKDGDPKVDGAVARGVPADVANAIFDEMGAFANYAFNKSHAAAYAAIAYQTAYLKAHYPKEYMAALLTSVLDFAPKVFEYIGECQNLGIKVLPPCINKSDVGFIVEGDSIRFGLVAIKNIGYGIIENCIAERTENGEFLDLYDFLSRMSGRDLNKKAIEGLIRSGALDCFGLFRSQMLEAYVRIAADIEDERKNNIIGQLDFFGGTESRSSDILYSDISEFPLSEKLKMEKEATGLYLSGHPLADYRKQLKSAKTANIGAVIASLKDEGGDYKDGDIIKIGGVIIAKKTKITKNAQTMAFITLEDETGSIESLVFPKILTKYSGVVLPESAVIATGRISAREDEEPKLLLESIVSLKRSDADEEKREKLYIKVPSRESEQCKKMFSIDRLKEGSAAVILYFEDTGKYMTAPEIFSAKTDKESIDKYIEAFGNGNIILK